jgi:hypothetical protein
MPTEFPGKNIAELKGKHSGPVALLFNGESLKDHDLSRIGIPTIGMNRTHRGWPGYTGPQPDYLCVVDKCWLDRMDWRRAVRAHPAVINGSYSADDVGYRVLRGAPGLFSFDLTQGYAGHKPCTVGHLALQAAVYLGFTELFCLGFDLGGKHFDGTNGSKPRMYLDAATTHKAQARLLEGRGVKVWVVGSPDSNAPFPKLTFAEAFA